MTRSVRDAAIMLRAMAGHDGKDSTSADVVVPDFEADLDKGVKGMTIGIPKEYRSEAMAGEIEALWQQGIAWLEEQGARTVEISLPHTKYALPAYYIVAPAEASSNLSRFDGVRFGSRVDAATTPEMYDLTRSQGFGAEVRNRIMLGTYALSAGYYDAYYGTAQRVRTLMLRDFAAAYEHFDVLIVGGL